MPYDFYPRPPRGGRPAPSLLHAPARHISIHALREEGDQHLLSCTLQHVIFLSTPSARRATSVLDTSVTATVFLSTPSARRATSLLSTALGTPTDFYPRPPRGGRRDFLLQLGICLLISIHALREEGDSALWTSARARYDFYPRPPRGGRLECIGPRHGAKKISIHALREEGDGHRQGSGAGAGHFYPRPPRGGRRSSPPPGHRWSRYFYPRPPRGGRRDQSVCPNFIHFISIHALREEGDVIVGDVLVCCGGISIHALREEGDP